MPLPQPGTSWPPKPFGPAFDQYAVNAAWYEGNTDALNRIYTGGQERATGNERVVNGTLRRGGLRGFRDRWINGAPVNAAGGESSGTRIHAPLATNVASLNADVLVSEPATVRIQKDGDTLSGSVQTALDLLLNSDQSRLAFRRGVEWSCGIGGFAMSWAWAAGVNDNYPWLQVHAADTVIPTYTQGWLTSLAVVDTYPLDGDLYLRHIMSHDPGSITHGLFVGKADKLGELTPFSDRKVAEFTPHLVTLGNETDGTVSNGGMVKTFATGTQLLTAQFIPNKDTIRFRREGVLSNLGRATLEGGAEPFLDAHDEAWSSLMRDLRLGRGRMFIPASMLESMGPGAGAAFDDFAEFFSPITSLGGDDAGLAANLSAQQFAIRTEPHFAVLKGTTAEVLQFAGLSQSSYGENDGGVAQTATDSVDRAKKTERTRDTQQTRLRVGLKYMARSGLALLDALPGVVAAGAYDPEQLEAEFPEVSQIDPEKQARVINYLHGANAISTFMSVKLQHPDWQTSEVQTEVNRILQEQQTVGVDPFAITDPTNPVDPQNGSGVNDASQNDQAGTPAPAGN